MKSKVIWPSQLKYALKIYTLFAIESANKAFYIYGSLFVGHKIYPI